MVNLACQQDLSPFGLPDSSFNDMTPLDDRVSVAPSSIDEVQERLSWLTLVKGVRRDQIRLGIVDIKTAYTHVPLTKNTARQVLFKVDGVTYITLVLPYGSAAAASIFIRICNLLQGFWSSRGVITTSFVDDICNIAVSPRQSHTALTYIRAVLKYAGAKVNEEKSDKHGAQRRDFIGFTIDTSTWSIQVKETVSAKLRASIAGMLGGGDLMKLSESLAGSLGFVSRVIRVLKPVSAFFHRMQRRQPHYVSKRCHHYLALIQQVIEYQDWRSILWPAHEIARQHDMQLASDSSGDYLGAVGFDKDGNMWYLQEKWSDLHPSYAAMHINDKEYLASVAMIQLLGPIVGPGYKVLPVLIDNRSAVAWINNMYAAAAPEYHAEELPAGYSDYPTAVRGSADPARCEEPAGTSDPSTAARGSADPARCEAPAGTSDRPRARRRAATRGAAEDARSAPSPSTQHRWKQRYASAQPARLEWLIQFALYLTDTDLVILATYVKSAMNILPDALSREDLQHIFDSASSELESQGKRVVRVRVPAGWHPGSGLN